MFKNFKQFEHCSKISFEVCHRVRSGQCLHLKRYPRLYIECRRVLHNFKYKKVLFLAEYGRKKGKMSHEEIKKFLSVQASFESHISSYPKLNSKNLEMMALASRILD